MFPNFKQSINYVANNNLASSEVVDHLSNVHKEACDAKHEGWYSGNAYFLDDVKEIDNKGLVSKRLKAFFLKVNSDANKAKHPVPKKKK